MKLIRAVFGTVTVFLSISAQQKAAGDAAITQPPIPAVPSVSQVFKPGASLTIEGTAAGAEFQGFIVEWARGLNPVSGWSSQGLTLAGGGASPVSAGLLATWLPGTGLESDYYTLRLRVENGSASDVATTTVYLERDLYSANWPKWLGQSPGGKSPRVFYDAEGKGRLALVNPRYSSSTFPSLLWVFSPDGATIETNSLTDGSSLEPAVGNIDSLAGDELVVADAHALRVVRTDGTFYSFVPAPDSNLQHALMNLVDLNGDYRPEIVALGSDLRNSDGWLYAWTTNGNAFNTAFPVRIPDADFDLRFSTANRVTQADLDMDGLPELLVIGCDSPGTFSLIVLRGNGEPGPWGPLSFNGAFRQVAAGDLNHDGLPEIVLAYSDSAGSLVQVLSAEGAPRPGWPVRLGGGLPVHVVLGDLDRDGHAEIVVTEYAKLYVFRDDGSAYPGWPLLGGAFNLLGVPVIADVDNDRAAEIVVPVGNLLFSGEPYNDLQLKVFESNGQVSRSWRLLGANGNQPSSEGTPAIGDFDADGQAELAINYRVVSGGGSSGYLHEGVLTVLRVGVPHRPHPGDWPAAFHDARNSSRAFTAAKLQIAKSTFGLRLSWPYLPEVSTIQFTDSLEAPSWRWLTGFFALDKGRYSTTVQATNDLRFYRLHYP